MKLVKIRKKFQLLTSIKKVLIFFFFLVCPLLVYADIEPTKEFYVNDYANILYSETKEEIIRLNKLLENKTGAQIVVVTIDNLENDTIENVAYKTFNNFGIGNNDKDNGILIIISKSDRKIRVEVGRGLEETLNDSKVGRMMDQYMIPFLKLNEYDKGIKNGFNAFYNYLLEYYNITDIESEEVIQDVDIMDNSLTALIILIIIVVMIIRIKNGHYGLYGGSSHGGWYSSSGGSFGGGSFGGGGSSGGGGASRGF